MSAPSVSVVMAVHNRADYLAETLASIRWQTLTDWECLCVDDGSTDATPEILARFASFDPRFRIIRQPHSGVVAALNRGDAAARSPWIARMDSDDIMLPRRLEAQLAATRRLPDCVGLGSDIMLIDSAGAPIGRRSYATEHEEIEQRMLTHTGARLAHPTLFYRYEAGVRAGGYRHEYEAAHDCDFHLRLAHAGRLTNLPEVLLLYRQHTGNFHQLQQARITDELSGMLRDAHEARGLTPPRATQGQTDSRRRTPTLGRLARIAAHNGYVSTAAQLAMQQTRSDPWSSATVRVLAEVALRSVAAMAGGKRGAPIDTPDWKAWDAPPSHAVNKAA